MLRERAIAVSRLYGEAHICSSNGSSVSVAVEQGEEEEDEDEDEDDEEDEEDDDEDDDEDDEDDEEEERGGINLAPQRSSRAKSPSPRRSFVIASKEMMSSSDGASPASRSMRLIIKSSNIVAKDTAVVRQASSCCGTH